MSLVGAKAERFRALHRPGAPFIIPNPWDAGSARMLAALGAQALATTSAGFAFTLGRPDMGQVSRDEMLAHCQAIVAATPLPVSADLENGFGEAPEMVADTVRMGAEAGLVGCTIEDTALPSSEAYDFDLALERVKAAVSAARGLGFPFMLT
ncbi:MAG: isocitrate lyase/PEP mutase family protein, partial [Thermohalobaculum sp.]